MAYVPLQPVKDHHADSVSMRSFTTCSATHSGGSMITAQSSSLDELPLIDTSSTLTKFRGGYDTRSYITVTNDLGDDVEVGPDQNNGDSNLKIFQGRLNFSKSLRSWLNGVSRYIRSSGSAIPSPFFRHTTSITSNSMPTGWRLGTCICCLAVALCIVVEVILLAYTEQTSHNKRLGILLEGSCEEVREVELWLLLPLNIVGTILIATSNYVMQVMCAPERSEIDKAHSTARSLAVGGLRFRNTSHGKWNKSRRAIWWILGLSSVPIHFLLNVAIYSSVQASNTGILIVEDEFRSDTAWEFCNSLPSDAAMIESTVCSLYHNYINGTTHNMTVNQCLQQYSSGFQTNASSVIIVTDQGSQRWDTVPVTAEVPNSVSYGLHCLPSYGHYVETSTNSYNFTHDSAIGSTTVALTFIPFCEKETKNGMNDIKLTTASKGDFILATHDELFLEQYNALSNITSIKALFSAFQYRYWVSASYSGQYLGADQAALLDNRDPRMWLCPRDSLEKNQQCDPRDLQQENEWLITPNSLPVRECHVLPKVELCTLCYSSSILIITICFDVIKLSAMIIAVVTTSRPLITLGDIIESFIQVPDPYSQDCGILDDDLTNDWLHEARHKILDQGNEYVEERMGREFRIRLLCADCGERLSSARSIEGFNYRIVSVHRESDNLALVSSGVPQRGEQAFVWLCQGGLWWTTVWTNANRQEARVSTRRRWVHVLSPSRVMWSTLFYIPTLSLAVVYFAINFRSVMAHHPLRPWTVGFAAPDPNSLLTGGLAGTTSIYKAAMLINGPQMVLSMLYFVFNATLTMMHTAHEWASLAVHRKALRVSSPRGRQRSTYWLQLPWTYSIPLIIFSGSMHWLLSRSLYVVKVDVYGYLGVRDKDQDYFACGYSPIPALLLVSVLVLMGATIFGLCFRWLPLGMPLVRLNSLAIAAACHVNPEEKDLEIEPLMWGEIQGYLKNGMPHCTFSAKEVNPTRNYPTRVVQEGERANKFWPRIGLARPMPRGELIHIHRLG